MELYILRHGIAEDVSRTGRDSDRELTVDGHKKLRETLKVAAKAGVAPNLIGTSPYARAVQTAQAAAEELKYDGKVVEWGELVPDARPEDVWAEIRTHRDEACLLLSSHNPLCSRLVAYLLASPNLWIDFKKGAIVGIEFDQFGPEPHGVLRWMLVPRLAR